MKYAVVLVHVRTCVVTVEGSSADNAVYQAKKDSMEKKLFESRLGTILCAEVIEVDEDKDKTDERDTS